MLKQIVRPTDTQKERKRESLMERQTEREG